MVYLSKPPFIRDFPWFTYRYLQKCHGSSPSQPQEPDALQDLFGALGMQLPEVAVPPERGRGRPSAASGGPWGVPFVAAKVMGISPKMLGRSWGYDDLASGNLTKLWKDPPFFHGKIHEINHHFQ